MRTKREFLNTLRQKLEDNNLNNIDDIISYYDELFEDKKEQGKRVKDIINELGDIDIIIDNIKNEQREIVKIKEVKKPMSSEAKALITIALIFALPIGIPLIIVAIALMFTAGVLVFSLFLGFASVFIALVITAFALVIGLFFLDLPFISFVTVLGIVLMLTALMFELCRGIIKLFEVFFNWVAKKINKKLGGKHD